AGSAALLALLIRLRDLFREISPNGNSTTIPKRSCVGAYVRFSDEHARQRWARHQPDQGFVHMPCASAVQRRIAILVDLVHSVCGFHAFHIAVNVLDELPEAVIFFGEVILPMHRPLGPRPGGLIALGLDTACRHGYVSSCATVSASSPSASSTPLPDCPSSPSP